MKGKKVLDGNNDVQRSPEQGFGMRGIDNHLEWVCGYSKRKLKHLRNDKGSELNRKHELCVVTQKGAETFVTILH